MKVIAESEQERLELIALSKYLHDFRIFKKSKSVTLMNADGRMEKIGNSELVFLDSERFPLLSKIQHLYENGGKSIKVKHD